MINVDVRRREVGALWLLKGSFSKALNEASAEFRLLNVYRLLSRALRQFFKKILIFCNIVSRGHRFRVIDHYFIFVSTCRDR